MPRPQPPLDVATHTLERSRSNDALWGAPNAHEHIHRCTGLGGFDGAPHVAVADHADAGAGLADVGYQLGMAGAVQHQHRDIPGVWVNVGGGRGMEVSWVVG